MNERMYDPLEWTPQDEAQEILGKKLPAGSRIYTRVVRTSRIGVSQFVRVYYVNKKGELEDISEIVAAGINYSYNTKRQAVKVMGQDLDRGSHLVKVLSFAVHGKHGEGDFEPGYTYLQQSI